MAVPESGGLQSAFSKSAGTMMDQDQSLALINKKVAAIVNQSGSENPAEMTRRTTESIGRLLGDEYMLAVQNEKPFELKSVLNGLSDKETPNSLNERAATIENRVITQGEKPDPSRRLTNGTTDQGNFLERAAIAIKEEYAKSGDVSSKGAAGVYAEKSYGQGLTPADVANFTMLTEGIKIPEKTLSEMVATPAPGAAAAPTAAAPAAEPVASTPKAP